MSPPSRSSPAKFPWDDAMRLGLGVLRLSPDAFWRMTPRELKHAADGAFGRGGKSLSRENLDALMRAYPDG